MNGRTIEESYAAFLKYLTSGPEHNGGRKDWTRPARHRYTGGAGPRNTP